MAFIIGPNKPDKIILHCSATPDNGDRFGSKDINEWHKKKGWSDYLTGISTGYHYVIRRSGVIESFSKGNECRPESSIGAHCHGYNTNSLGICYIGTRIMTAKQLVSWMELYPEINDRWNIPIDRIYGHNEFSTKECPGFNVHIMRLFMERELG